MLNNYNHHGYIHLPSGQLPSTPHQFKSKIMTPYQTHPFEIEAQEQDLRRQQQYGNGQLPLYGGYQYDNHYNSVATPSPWQIFGQTAAETMALASVPLIYGGVRAIGRRIGDMDIAGPMGRIGRKIQRTVLGDKKSRSSLKEWIPGYLTMTKGPKSAAEYKSYGSDLKSKFVADT